jgi:hypothetical protein
MCGGTARRYALQVAEIVRSAALLIYGDDATVGELGVFSLGGELWSFRAWPTMTPRFQPMSLAGHFVADRVGCATHSYCTSFEERP